MNSNISTTTSFLKRRRGALLASALALGLVGYAGQATFFAPGTAIAQSADVAVSMPSFRPIVERVSPAVVSIRVESKAGPVSSNYRGFDGFPPDHPMRRFFDRFEDRSERQRGPRRHGERRSRGQGSGFFISADGYLVTNSHVIERAESVTVILNDGKTYGAEIVGTDDKTDLALLKVESDRRFPFVNWSDNDVYVGDWVVAVGNPFGLGGTVTAGIVSARGREIGSGPYDDYIQIDAPINRGNSGGPTFDLTGNVVGVNTAIFSPSGGSVGIGFAIPASIAQEIVEDLKDDGRVVRGWLGVQIQPVTADIAESLGLDGTAGALVSEPQENSPAERAGIRAGDTIVAVDGEAVDSPRGLARLIAGYDPRTEVDVTLWRDGERREVSVTLGRLPGNETRASLSDETPRSGDGRLGLALAQADVEGVAIVEVEPDSVAAEKGLRSGDVILSIGGETVSAPGDVTDGVARARAAGRNAVLFQVQSRRGVRFVALPLERG